MVTWFLGTRLGRWLTAIGAVIITVLSAWFVGRMQGAGHQKKKDDEQNSNANEEAAKQVTQAIEDRAHVDSEVQKLPDAPAQKVETADPATAAGKLRDDGWVQ